MGLPVRKENRIFSYADYRTWPQEERWELIDGVAYDMSPAPNRRHQGIVGEIYREIANFLADKPCDVYISPFDVRLTAEQDAADDEIVNVVQPDVSVYCSKDKLDEAGAVAAPDIAVEILSPSTSVKDQREKLGLYERFGVMEYWIIDPANDTLSVYGFNGGGDAGNAGPAAAGGYGKPAVYGPEDTFPSAVLEGFKLKLAEIFSAE